MQYINGLEAFSGTGRSAVTLGKFDGLHRGHQKLVERVTEYSRMDGINSIAQYGADVLREKGCRVILTPHPKEFARLCQKELPEVLTNGAVLAKEFAAEYGVAVLLKGHTSVITNGNFTIFNTEGTPALAKGGSGDVLSGLIASLAARGATPAEPSWRTITAA